MSRSRACRRGLRAGCGAAFTLDVSRIFGRRLTFPDSFDRDDVLPAVAHVVGIEELAGITVESASSLVLLAANRPSSGQLGSDTPYRLSPASKSQR